MPTIFSPIVMLLAFLPLILGTLLVRPLAETLNFLKAQHRYLTIKKVITESTNLFNLFYRWVHAHCPFAGQVFYMTFMVFLTFYGRDLNADEYSLKTTIFETLFWSVCITIWIIDTCVLIRRRLGRYAIACILGFEAAKLLYAMRDGLQFSIVTVVLLFTDTMSKINLAVLLGQFHGLYWHWMGWPTNALDADW